MPSLLQKIGAVGLTFSCLLSAQAATAASTMCVAGMLGCGIAFETPIEPTPSPLTTTTTGQTTYTIINNDNVNDVNITISLTELDSIGDAMAVQFDNSMTCPQSGTLAAGATCTIVLDFAPSFPGELDWTLTVTPTSPYTAQLPQILTLETAVTGTFVPYAAAGGQYTDTSGNSYPLMTLSSNGGNDWNYVLDGATTPLPYQYNVSTGQNGVSANSCSGSYCVAGGSYTDINAHNYPFAASNAGGNSWSYTYDSRATLPSDYSTLYGAFFNGATCSGRTCMLAGAYYTGSALEYPFASMSTDGGTTWDLSMSSTLNAPSDMSPSNPVAQLTGVHCINVNTCFAVGSYINTASSNYPLVAQGNSSLGVWTWTYPDISTQIPSDMNDYAQLSMSNLSCVESTSTCIVGGAYGPPIVYMTFNANASTPTWSLMIDSSSSATPSDWLVRNTGFIYGASCSDTACAIAGTYFVNNSYVPYLATAVFSDTYPCTNATSCNWTSVIDSSNLHGLDLQTSFKSVSGGGGGGGEFRDVTCSETTCVASGFYTSSTDGARYPLVATVTLSDGTVTYTVDYSTINANLPTDYFLAQSDFAELYQVSCSGLFCSAAGSYESAGNPGNQYPFLITSQDAGNTWVYPYTIDGTTETLPSSFVSGYFNADEITPPSVKK